MHRGRQIAVLLIALLVAVALPTAAVAQSAGEDQYTDPLQGEGGGGGGGGSSGGGSGGGGGGGGGGGNAPAQSQQPATEATPAPAQATPAQATDPNDLPRTGFPVALLAASGVVLLAGGIGLRRAA
jgi:hypothetical protein